VPIKGAKRLRKQLLRALKEAPKAYRWERYEENFVRVNDREKYRGKMQEKEAKRWVAK
jgi:hypothetical protein